MRKLNKHKDGRGIGFDLGRTPKLIMACRRKKALVMEYLSDTLANRFEKCQFKFSAKTLLMLAMDMVF